MDGLEIPLTKPSKPHHHSITSTKRDTTVKCSIPLYKHKNNRRRCMNRLSVRQFSDYLNDLQYDKIIYFSGNQSWKDNNLPVISLLFENMVVSCQSNCISLKRNKDYIRFRKVKYIEVDTEKTILGIIINVVCDFKQHEIKYTLVAA